MLYQCCIKLQIQGLDFVALVLGPLKITQTWPFSGFHYLDSWSSLGFNIVVEHHSDQFLQCVLHRWHSLVREITLFCIFTFLAILISFFERCIQTTANYCYGELFPLMQMQKNVLFSLGVVFTMCREQGREVTTVGFRHRLSSLRSGSSQQNS